ncbi:MAG TPA: hypothetical protein VFP84_24515 [Kofleriaceae bacterium]|nr:hypothetical protein [Kofleriaceae bacterium]
MSSASSNGDGAAREAGVERLAGEVLHDEERAAIGELADVLDGDDAGVVEAGEGAGFAREALDGGGILAEARGDDLDRDPLASFRWRAALPRPSCRRRA